MNKIKPIIAAIFCLICLNINAQQNNKTRIHIVHADLSDYDEQIGDIDRLIGDVVIRSDSMYFYSDSAYFNDKSQFFKGYSNVHIKVNDTTDAYCDSCRYTGDTKITKLFSNVVLKDDSTVLKTNYLLYERSRHLATYPNHGTIDRNDKHLVSERGYYRDDEEMAYFYKNVIVTTPKYQMYTDSLFYKIQEEKMIFYGPTRIVSDDYVLTGNYGFYDGIKDVVFVSDSAKLVKSEYSIASKSMYYKQDVEYAKALDDVVIIDTVNKAIVYGNRAEMWKKLGKGYVTDSVRALYYGERDTLFLHSDTLYAFMDTLTEKMDKILAFNNVRFFRKDIQGKCDSLCFTVNDSTARMRKAPILWAENSQLTGDSINIVVANNAIDSVLLYPNGFIIQQDTIEGFNQIKGKTITAYFRDNDLDHVFNEGNAETAYWLREDDGSLIGVNFSQSPSMDIKLKDNQIVRIKYFGKTSEMLYPKENMKTGQEILKGFDWQIDLKPKDKNDIFRKPAKKVEDEGADKGKKRGVKS